MLILASESITPEPPAEKPAEPKPEDKTKDQPDNRFKKCSVPLSQLNLTLWLNVIVHVGNTCICN